MKFYTSRMIVDEFAIKMLMNYKEKEFKSVSSGDLGFEADEQERYDREKRTKTKNYLSI